MNQPATTPPTVLTMEEYRQAWEPQGWRLLIIGPTASWRLEWGEWEAIRDIVQNALDEAESYTWGYDSEGLWIADAGRGLQVADFLLGPPKPKPPYARGKFGEGLKISALALLRLDYKLRVETVGREMWLVFLKVRVNGEAQQLAALWRPGGRREGTRFHIIGYQGTAFDDRFIQNLPREAILHRGPSPMHQPLRRFNQLIGPPFQGRVYARDIYMGKIDSPWSYNLWGFEMAPDRHASKDASEVWKDMGRLWCTVSQVELLERLLGIVSSPPQERTHESDTLTFEYLGTEPITGVRYVDFITQQEWAWGEAWRRKFGSNVVLLTEPKYSRMVEHLGYTSTAVSYRVQDGLAAVLTTDRDIVLTSQERLSGAKVIPDEQLSATERAHLNIARTMAGMVSSALPGVTRAAIIPPASDLTRTAGMYISSTREILIHLSQLASLRTTIDTLVHEVAHYTSGEEDLTEGHSSAMSALAADIVRHTAEGVYDKLLEAPEVKWW